LAYVYMMGVRFVKARSNQMSSPLFYPFTIVASGGQVNVLPFWTQGVIYFGERSNSNWQHFMYDSIVFFSLRLVSSNKMLRHACICLAVS